MNLTLVNPPYSFWKDGTAFLKDLIGCEPPLGLLSLAAYVRMTRPGVRLAIVDAPARGLSIDEAVGETRETRPDVVGIGMVTAAAASAEAIAQRLKACLPGVKVVAGGPHVSGMGEGVMRARAFDVGVVGEGEETLGELIDAFGRGEGAGRVAGLMYRGPDGAVHRTAARKHIADLDSLPQPAWDLLPGFPGLYRPNVFFSPGGPAATLATSRGCPFECRFCDQSTFGRGYRAASPEYVFEGVRALKRDFGVRYIVFCDDTFTLDRGRVMALCGLLAKARLGVAWSCDANVMTVDAEMLGAMKSAGCWSIAYGIESGSQAMLDSLCKNIDLERARQAVVLTRAAGIRAKGLFMMGAPEESMDTIRQTRDIMRSMPLSTMNLSKFTPYPGSALSAEVGRAAAGLCAEPARMNGMNFVMGSKHLSCEDLEREYETTIRQFYSQARVRMGHAVTMFGHWGNIARLARGLPAIARAALRKERAGGGDNGRD